ncbi:Phospholipase D1, partial [Haplosporangium sp. Z 27]
MKLEDRIEYLRQNNLTRRKLLQEYMCQLLHQVGFNSAYNLYEFLEISALSVTKGMGWKGKEGYLHYRATNRGNSLFGLTKLSKWAKSWVMVRDSYVVLTDTVGSDEPTDVFLFDASFFVHYKEKTFGMKSHHIEFGNNARKFELRGGHTREMIEWMYDFEKIRYYSSWLAPHRFGSFAPEREDAKVKMYVDGKDYFHAVSDAILAARREIYICDWWLSPELYLRRPPEKNREFRLDRLLKRKAMEGVMIYVVVYKEVSLALTLDSAHTKIWLQDLHRNIQVQRHPDHVGVTTTMFWAHHEKICVIDCQLAFIGGLDLCFGRYDTGTHQLSDYHPSGHGTIWPGQDYNNPRIKDFVNG